MGFFENLAADRRRIALDCDVVVGHWTPRPEIDGSPDAIARLLARGGIDGALVTGAQAMLYDEHDGNAEARAWAQEHGWRVCHGVNLRDAYGIGERLDRWVAEGVRAIRLPTTTQGISPGTPGVKLTIEEAVRRNLLILAHGDFTTIQGALRGLGAKVIFLDVSYYEMADFLIAARDEPHFVASTRRFLGPDSLEIVCDEVGSRHLAFGSGAPLQDLEPTVWRLRDARISQDDFDAISGGTLNALLEA